VILGAIVDTLSYHPTQGQLNNFVSKVTTGEKKIGILLIQEYRKLKTEPSGFDPWWLFIGLQGQ